MRKNKSGRTPKKDLKEKVKKLREAGYSYGEIVEIVPEINSRQMARYHDLYPVDKVGVDI